MPRVLGGQGGVWLRSADTATVKSTMGERRSDSGEGAAGPLPPPGAQKFSSYLLDQLLDVEALLQEGEDATGIVAELMEKHGLRVDLGSGEWRSRGGWRGALGVGDAVFEGPPDAARRKRRGRHIKKKNKKEAPRNRHRVFVEWLVQTFGVDQLREGSGVLDIAGGKGLIGAELQERHHAPCTLVEERTAPAEVRLSGADSGGVPTRKPLSVPTSAAPFVKRWEDLAHAAGSDLAHEAGRRDADLLALCQDCSVMVGMHPDEVTEAIVDAALQLCKPFAVVPCCVFADMFPDRLTPAGRPVRSYEDFLSYLRAKHPGLREGRLNFVGRSRVIYWLAGMDGAPPEE
eukprot:jgi/Tetstr1/458573/TSEL_044976.t1